MAAVEVAIAELRQEMNEIPNRIAIRIGAIIVATAAVLTALNKLF